GFALLGGGRLWVAAAVFGTAAGPALGGALTELFEWRAIFVFGAPVAGLAAVAVLLSPRAAIAGAPPSATADRRFSQPEAEKSDNGSLAGAWIALAAVSAALTGVLFMLVLLLVSGWSLEPLAAAAAVSVLPVAALAGARIRGAAATRASAGSALVGAGVLALAILPEATVAWIVAPQLLAGLGMGLALPALAGELLPERTPREAAKLLSLRHAGITLALVALAPIAAAQLDSAVIETQERGAALVLDARLPPLEKLELAGPLVADLDPADPRDGLRLALDAQAGRFAGDAAQAEEYAALTGRADAMLVEGIGDAFRIPLLICGGLALLAAVAVLPRDGHGRTVVAGVAAAALILPAVHAVIAPRVGPERVAIADPCGERELPSTGGVEGFLQDAALRALDDAACRFGTSREELALALADPASARAYEREHGVDPRSFGGLLDVLGINSD
ncbi:MAG TPA: MFS transporter, partial [Solirubrobacteraceae bacterium]|nr:MFS transporter [Solirubrobacteraceae bacterium]